MKLELDIPDEYAEAVEAFLRRRGYRDTPHAIRRALRIIVAETLREHWWLTKGVLVWRHRGDVPPATLADRFLVAGITAHGELREDGEAR